MKKLKSFAKKLWQDESAQGATEYILLLVAVVAVLVIFGPKLKEMISAKVDDLSGSVQSFNP